jgi:serine/threonine/tyrosine-interacting protein
MISSSSHDALVLVECMQVLPNLFLGPYGAAKDLEAMQAKGITHVLIVRSTLERRLDAKFPNLFKYHIVEVPEGPTENLILFFTGMLHHFLI